MDPCDFLDLANILKSSPDEASRRSAVSRAYYAVYHYIRSYLSSHNIPDRCVKHHDPLIRCLRNSGVREVEILGDTVRDLKGDRMQADYELDLTKFTAKTCCEFCRTCRETINEFQSYEGTSLVAGVRNYLISVGDIPSR